MDCGSGSRPDKPRLPLVIAFLTQFAGSSDLAEVIDTAADVNRESFR
jgi:hypothetical protein